MSIVDPCLSDGRIGEIDEAVAGEKARFASFFACDGKAQPQHQSLGLFNHKMVERLAKPFPKDGAGSLLRSRLGRGNFLLTHRHCN